jgi:hypothetical protein
MAVHILNYPTIAPYADKFSQYGLSRSSIINTANSEPTPHIGWGNIVNLSVLHAMPLTSYNVGSILHAAADGGVAVQHNPAVWDNTYAHDLFEARAEEVDFPSFDESDLVGGTWYNIKTVLYDDQIALSEDYRDWYNDQLVPLYAPAAMVKDGMRNGLRMSEAILKQYFDYYGFFEPATTIAAYRFDECMDQYAYNYSGSADKKLRLGSSTGADSSDPTWDTGLYVGSIRCRPASGGAGVYARSQSWTTANAIEMTPAGSYALEVIFRADSFPVSSVWDNNNPMGLVKYYDGATGGKVQYQLVISTENVGGSLHKTLRYYSDHADGTYTDIIFDSQAMNFEMLTGRWYYAGVIYNNAIGQLEIILRDMNNDGLISQTYSSKPMAPMTAAPSPVFLVGSQRMASRSLDGRIDEVRISNDALDDIDRLYGGTALAHWKFDDKSPGSTTTAGERVVDSSGNGRDLYAGTGSSLPTFGQPSPLYGQSAAISLTTGSDELIFAPGHEFASGEPAGDNMEFGAEDNFTIEAAIYSPSSNQNTSGIFYGIIASQCSVSGKEVWLRLTDVGRLQFWVKDGTTSSSIMSPTGFSLHDNSWHHVAAVRNSIGTNKLRLYVDYILVAEVNDNTVDSLTSDTTWYVGSFPNSSTREFNGRIDFLCVSRGSLPPERFITPSQYASNPWPINGATKVSQNCTLTWMPLDTGVNMSQMVKIAADAAMQDIILNASVAGNTASLNLTGLEFGKTHYWRIDTDWTNSGGAYTQIGNVWNFTVVKCLMQAADGDLNNDCIVDMLDLKVLMNNWLVF